MVCMYAYYVCVCCEDFFLGEPLPFNQEQIKRGAD